MALFKCKMCGGTLEINSGTTVCECEYCGTQQTLPRLEDDRKANLYDRANHFRRNNDYDKAAEIYNRILNEDKTDAESYWSLVLCRYGIEYVEDPTTHRRVPTINRAQYTSIFADENYKAALTYADLAQKSVYEAEAKAIDEIQKGILEISKTEAPFDVFICYKETDANGRRTPDSVIATELYHQLTNEGFKVFFSRITLEDKLGAAYEPYIFAALNSAKVMVAMGTKPEHFNAVWVKNEWARYLYLISNGEKKTLIPAYRDMDPYDLPEEFSHLQALDMSKLGFMQDLIRGIKKILDVDKPKTQTKETVVVNSNGGQVSPLLKRGFMFCEDQDWKSADEYFERVLDLDPENAYAYLGKLMADIKVIKPTSLKSLAQPFDMNPNYIKAVRFGDDKIKTELSGYVEFIKERNELAKKEEVYNKAIGRMRKGTVDDYNRAIGYFAEIIGYKDADTKSDECARLRDKLAEEIKRKEEAARLLEEKRIEEARIVAAKKAEEERIAEEKRREEAFKRAEEDRIAAFKRAEEDRIAAEARKKKNARIGAIAGSAIAVCIAIVLIVTQVVMPAAEDKRLQQQANDMRTLIDAGNYDEAYEMAATAEMTDYSMAVAADTASKGAYRITKISDGQKDLQYKYDNKGHISKCTTSDAVLEFKNEYYDSGNLSKCAMYENGVLKRTVEFYDDKAANVNIMPSILSFKSETECDYYVFGQYQHVEFIKAKHNWYEDGKTEETYNESGKKTSFKSINSNGEAYGATSEFSYDENGNEISEKYTTQNIPNAIDCSHDTNNTYEDGVLVKAEYEWSGGHYEKSFDKNGNLIGYKSPDGETSIEYFAGLPIESVFSASGKSKTVTRTFEYDALGNLRTAVYNYTENGENDSTSFTFESKWIPFK